MKNVALFLSLTFFIGITSGQHCTRDSVSTALETYKAELNCYLSGIEARQNDVYKSRACQNNRYRSQGYYKKSMKGLTYYKAKEYCHSIGGHLPYINMKTTSDRNNVMTKMNIKTKLFWVGLTDIKKEGVFQWDDGTIANKRTVGFAPGEPSGKGEHATKLANENCVTNWMFPNKNIYSPLNDLRCTFSLQDLSAYLVKYAKTKSYKSVALCEFTCD